MNNERKLSVKLTRNELIDLLLLCGYHDKDAEKWGKLHSKLNQQLKSYDEKNLDKGCEP